jgi:CRISPR-associated protein Cas5d
MERLAVHVEGPLACFTRPEFVAERVSYPVITPTAAEGLLSSIFWKPEFDWRIREIWVLNPVRWESITRNEVASRASLRAGPLDSSDSSVRVQRHSLCLRDVAYVLFADIELRARATDPPAKYRDQFRRRVERGACFSRPYLGLQEFHAEFRPFDPAAHRPCAAVLEVVGMMPLDLRFDPTPGIERIDPLFFAARVEDGRLAVPHPSEVADVAH